MIPGPMAGSRGESWWQPPKDFDGRASTDDQPGSELLTEDDDEFEYVNDLGDDDEFDDVEDELEDDDDVADELDHVGDEVDDDPLEVELEDDRATAPVGWTSPTGDVI